MSLDANDKLSLDANDKLRQTRSHERNTITSRKPRFEMRKGISTIRAFPTFLFGKLLLFII